MAKEKLSLVFDAEIQTNIDSIKTIINSLRRQLNDLKIPSSASKGFERNLQSLSNELSNFEAIAERGVESLADTKKAEASWLKVSNLLGRIGHQIKDLKDSPEQIFSKATAANIEAANKALELYQKKMESVRRTQSYKDKVKSKTEATRTLNTAEANAASQTRKFEEAQARLEAGERTWASSHAANYEQQKRELAKVNNLIEEQTRILKDQKKVQADLNDEDVVTKEGELQKSFKRSLSRARLEAEEKERALEAAKEAQKVAEQTEKTAKTKQSSVKGQLTKLQKKGLKENDPAVIKQIENKTAAEAAYAQAQQNTAEAVQAVQQAEQALEVVRQRKEQLEQKAIQAEGAKQQIAQAQEKKKSLIAEQNALKTTVQEHEEFQNQLERQRNSLVNQEAQLQRYKDAVNQAKEALNQIKRELSEAEISSTEEEWGRVIAAFERFSTIDFSEIGRDTEALGAALEDYKTDSLRAVPISLEAISREAERATPAVAEVGRIVDETSETAESISRAAKETERLKDSILEFFSVSNTIQIFKDAIRDAYNTVKELDAAMTETAVVTDFTIGDMWNQLPRYTQAANDLGTTTLGAYETMTLFYQQGLKTDEVFDIGTETMKMARIAGLDYADATNKMTAALRGFNMELDETSARRVNDVYSELAAITAADTEEIANAMTKTASIAHNANMEFETTAAFLSQIIETTRESAETAGTAMKTVIARFQELKKDPSLIGEVDGEIVDANKIESALRTVGVALRDSSGQFRDLDDVFLELASKWKDMDKNTQRYIATVAAGSRQQSRFIAMMSDYDRTMELVNAANESAGASQRQFEKTVDSLESKLNRLSNAWAEYTMGLANSTVIKGAVDTLTLFLNALNDITSWTGNEGLGGVITGFNKLALTIAALRGGGALADTFFGYFGMLNEDTKGLYKFANGLEAIKLTAKDIPGMFASLGEKASVFKTKIVDAFGAAKAAFSVTSLLKYIGVIGGIVAALTVVVGVYKAIKAASPEAQLERAAELTKEASEAANEAAQSYNTLNDSLKNIEEGTSTLENLTRGTQEWKQAVQDVNRQILELIEKYPELAAFVESKGGILTINENKKNAQGQRAEDIRESYLSKKNQAAGVESIAKIAEIRAQSAVDFQDLQADAKVYSIEYQPVDAYGAVTETQIAQKDVTEALALALARGEAAPNKEGIDSWASEKGYDNLKIENLNIKALTEFGYSLQAAEEAMSVFTQSLTTNALAQMDVASETAEMMTGFMTDDRVEAIYANALENVEVNTTNKDHLADIMGWDYDGGKFYAGEGEDRHEVEGMTDEYFKELYASVLAQETITSTLMNFSSAMKNWESGFSTEIFSALTAAYGSSSGEQLTKGDLKSLEGVNLENLYKQGGGETTLGSYDQFVADFNSFIDQAITRFNEAEGALASLGVNLDSFNFNESLTSGALEGLSLNLEQIYDESGFAGVRLIMSELQEMTEGLEDSEVEDFVSSLNAIDWTNIDSIEGLTSSLRNFGIEVNGGETALNELANAIIKLGGATRNWDLETLGGRIDQTSQLISDISSGEKDDRIFSAEEAEILRKASPDIELTRTGEDSFVYAGDNLKHLTEVLSQYVSNLITTTPSFENATQEQKTDMLTTAYSSMSGFDMLNMAPDDEAQEKAIANTMKAKIAQENLQKQIEEATVAITEENKEFAKNEKAVKALVLDANEASKATEKLCETIEDNSEAFKEGNKQIAEGGKASDSYYKILSQISTQAKNVFGGVATEEFVQANAEAFEQLAGGGAIGAAAFEKIQEAARQATLTALESDERIAGTLTDIQNWIAQADLDFSVNGYADITDIVNKLLTVGYTIEETKALLESLLGASVNFKVEYQKMVLPRAAYDAMYRGQAGVTAKDINGMMYEVSIPKAITTSGGAIAKKKTYRNSGYKPSGSSGGGGGGSSGGSKEEEKWENSYDKLYNLTREINEELRERERIERRYQKLLKAHHTGAEDIAGVSEKEIAHLQEEAKLQEKLIAGRKQQMNEYLKNNSSLSKYANIETNERGEQILRIDWNAINKVTDQEKGQEIEDYISQLEEWLDSIDEANDTLNEIQDTVEEIKERGKDEYLDLEDRIKEALAQSYQDEIDKLSAINDSINDTNSKLIDAMQNSIDKARQDRENTEREEEIADKQRQLAYLQQDTSGANDMAILRLQEEITQAQQDQTDALIDQKISELQEQNDKAAEQRQQQIDLAQAQLDHYIASGAIWQEVYDLMHSGLDKEDGLVRGSKLEEILKNAETFEGLSQIGQMEWLKELNANVASALAYLKVGRQLEDLGLKEGTSITFTTADGKTITGKMDKQGNVTVDGKTYSDVYQGFDGSYYSDEKYENKNKPVSTPAPDEKPKNEPPAEEWKPSVGNMVKIIKGAKFVSGEKVMEAIRAEGVISGKKGAFKVLKDNGNGNFYVGRSWSKDGVTGLINKKYLTKYKTGGLADFTGPAWLDGTKSKPEMVLNSRDTQNFIQLKNILSELLARGGIGTTTENSGDNTYDIDINVDTIGSDYDLDKLASKVRSMINSAAQYRNNNAISLKR